MEKLSRQQIMQVITRYIGSSGGYLADFSYNTHSEFYPVYCGLNIEPDAMEGTTRQRFARILEEANPTSQAKILRGILKRFPPEAETPAHLNLDRRSMYDEINVWISQLELSSTAVPLNFEHSCATVMRPLKTQRCFCPALREQSVPMTGYTQLFMVTSGIRVRL